MPTSVSLPQLVDIAIGTPEKGAVNFNSLHKLLHAIVSKLNLTEFSVDFHDDPMDSPAIALDNILRSEPDTTLKLDARQGTKSSVNILQEKVSKIERDLSLLNQFPYGKDLYTKVKTEQPLPEMWRLINLSKKVETGELGIKTAMDMIQEIMDEQRRIQKDLEELKTKVNKVDLSTLQEKLSKVNELSQQVGQMDDMRNKLTDLDTIRAQLDSLQGLLLSYPPAEELLTWPGLEDALNGVRGEFAAYRAESRFRQLETRGNVASISQVTTTAQPSTTEERRRISSPLKRNSRDKEMLPTLTSSDEVQKVPDGISQTSVHAAATGRPSAISEGPSHDLIGLLERLGTVDARHEELRRRVDDLEEELRNKASKDDMISKIPENVLSQVASMNEAFSELDTLKNKDHTDSKAVYSRTSSFRNSLLGGSSDAEAMKRAQTAIMDLQVELDHLQKMTDFLNRENEEKTKALEELARDSCRQDMEKADKEYLEIELETKADKKHVDSKVNRSAFDSAIGDLHKMIDDLLSKLLAYEEAWKKAHAKLEGDIDEKLERAEMDRLKIYIDKKLKDMKAKMKTNQSSFNPFVEDAAGMKRQLLPFNCLSCDKPVLASTTNPGMQIPPGDGFTASRSSRPYTAYELEQIRQQAKRVYKGERPHIHSLSNADSVADYFAAPRACGGFHTALYSRRGLKSGHREGLPKDNGESLPEIMLPSREETVLGADGQLYKGRVDIRDPADSRDTSLSQETSLSERPKTSGLNRRISSLKDLNELRQASLDQQNMITPAHLQ